MDTLKSILVELTEQVARRLRQHQRRCRNVEIKVRYSDFSTVTRSRSLQHSTDLTEHIWETAEQLIVKEIQRSTLAVRLLGIGVGVLDDLPKNQLELFTDDNGQKQAKLDLVMDKVKDRFGSGTIRRGLKPKAE